MTTTMTTTTMTMTTTMTTTHGDGDHWQRRRDEQDIVLAHRPDVHIFNRIEELQAERAPCVMHPECKKGMPDPSTACPDEQWL